jgi:CheY-like chemotaxis protein
MAQAANTHPTATQDGASHSAFRILIVEDDEHIARLIATSLTPMKLDVRIAMSGPDALTAFDVVQPHLMLLDMMLPGISGRDVCARIRETSTIPIIMLTAKDSEDDQLQGFKAGADDYILKPFTPKLLMARVAAQLRRAYKYDAPPPVEAEEDKRQRLVAEAASAIGGPSVADMDRKLPPGWAQCEQCAYMGPRHKFEKENILGRRHTACPRCTSPDHIVFSLDM